VNRRRLAGVLLLCLLVAAVYGQTAGHPFVNLDDPDYVYDNSRVLKGLSAENVAWAFTTFHAANWHPLTWLSHMADVSLFGPAPGAHHLVNVAVHLANALLLFLGLLRLTGAPWRSLLAAALFAAHPLNVESVAWVSERKNLLSTLFMLLSIGAYARHAASPSAKRFAAVALLFALSLLCKPMPVTLPLLLLLLDFWPLRRMPADWSDPAARLRVRALLREKAPLLALSAASAAVTLVGQAEGGALRSLATVPPGLRIANALVSFTEYLSKAAWPSRLVPFYPLPPEVPAWQAAASAALLAGLAFLAFRARREKPWLLAGAGWYLVSLLPVIGLVQVGNAAMADRYAYVPLIGPFVAAAWALADAVGERRRGRIAATAACALAVAALSGAAWRQAAYWGDGVKLFSKASAEVRESWLVMNNLGMAYEAQGDHRKAVDCFREVVRINPRYAPGWNNLGMATDAAGNPREAMSLYREALRLDPGSAEAWNNMAVAANRLGQVVPAIEDLREAIRLDPEYSQAWFNLGVAYDRLGRTGDAAACYREALRIRPGFEKAQRALKRQ
jgi:tetratricopeptide (TPR) repeat protein